jgi:hypothetical protein
MDSVTLASLTGVWDQREDDAVNPNWPCERLLWLVPLLAPYYQTYRQRSFTWAAETAQI